MNTQEIQDTKSNEVKEICKSIYRNGYNNASKTSNGDLGDWSEGYEKLILLISNLPKEQEANGLAINQNTELIYNTQEIQGSTGSKERICGIDYQPKEIQDWRELVAKELTHREDGKKPQLHPKSLWNVKLILLIERILKEKEAKHKKEIEEIRDKNIKNLIMVHNLLKDILNRYE